ncbi:MAG: Gfo/Idh/MocA family protein [Paracoccaceae bacterium]
MSPAAGTVAPVRMLILGTGNMASKHAEHFGAMPGVSLVGGVDTSTDRLTAFRDRWKIAQGFASVDEALAWGQFDAVANVTPDAAHYPTTMPLLAAGKHVFCEKPLAVTHSDAAAMARAARDAGVVTGVNLTYRNGPAIQHAARLVAEGAIGTVRHFEASYLQSWLTQAAWGDWRTMDQWLWRLSTAHGSKGVLGDVGIHILDFLTFAAGLSVTDVSCRLATFDKAPGGRIGPYVLDANDSCAMTLRLSNGAIGSLHASRFASGHVNDLRLRLFGDNGGILVTFERDESRLRICTEPGLQTGEWRDVDLGPVATNYDRFIAALRGGAPMKPDFDRGAELQQVLDRAVASDNEGGVSQRVGGG